MATIDNARRLELVSAPDHVVAGIRRNAAERAIADFLARTCRAHLRLAGIRNMEV